MTLLFADGLEDGTTAWQLTNSGLGTGRYGNCLTNTSTGGSMTMSFPATVGPIFCGFAYKTTSVSTTICALQGANTIVSIDKGVSGDLALNVGSGGSLSGITTAPVGTVPAGAWVYIETRLVVHSTTGAFSVRVNGVTVLDATGDTVVTGAASVSSIRFGGSGAAGVCNVDDFYLCDGNGTVNNNFLGDLTVEHLRPASDDTAQWVGSDGNSVNNWDLVDEAGVFNGADYVQATTVGQRDLYVPVASARPTSSTVMGVIATAVAMKTDTGPRTVKIDVKEGAGGTVRQSAELGLPTTFGELLGIFERKGDGSEFTVADVNALRMGLEVVT